MSYADSHAWYGGYVKKEFPMVPLKNVQELERWFSDTKERLYLAEGEIQRAHTALDKLGVRRLQENGLPYSLEGRLRTMIGG